MKNVIYLLFCFCCICLASGVLHGRAYAAVAIDVACTEGLDGWCLSDARVTLGASDNGGSGPVSIQYRLNGRAWKVYETPFFLSTAGTTTIEYRPAEDHDGNEEVPQTAVVKIDKTMPLITASMTPAPTASGWFNQDVAIDFTCVDAVSGVASCEYAKIISSEGAGQVIVGTARDAAGHSATIPVTLNIDKTPPAITITGITDDAVYAPGAVPLAGYEVADAFSGVENHGASLSGESMDNGTRYTYSVDARDKAGHSISVTVNYMVSYRFRGFFEPISPDRLFRLGSTIPVKFQLMDAQGKSISTALATIMLQQLSGEEPVGEPVTLPASGGDSGGRFRYDAMKDLYIYDLSTRGLAQGTWQIRAALDDGSMRSAIVQLKRD